MIKNLRFGYLITEKLVNYDQISMTTAIKNFILDPMDRKTKKHKKEKKKRKNKKNKEKNSEENDPKKIYKKTVCFHHIFRPCLH